LLGCESKDNRTRFGYVSEGSGHSLPDNAGTKSRKGPKLEKPTFYLLSHGQRQHDVPLDTAYEDGICRTHEQATISFDCGADGLTECPRPRVAPTLVDLDSGPRSNSFSRAEHSGAPLLTVMTAHGCPADCCLVVNDFYNWFLNIFSRV
jgi:hypothetical protein